MVRLSLALACLRGGDPAASAALFTAVLDRFDLVEAWTGLAAAAHQLGDTSRAVAALARALSRHVVPPSTYPLAAAIAAAAGLPGWCAIGPDGRLHADAPADLATDGAPIRARWTAAATRRPTGSSLAVTRGGVALLGSPIDLALLATVEGFVEPAANGLTGWAWHPRDPTRSPVLTATAPGWQRSVTAKQLVDGPALLSPLAQPRAFSLAAADLPASAVHVQANGRDLLGSPLDPGLERRSAAGLATRFQPVWADIVGPAPAIQPRRRAIDVVVPVYGGAAATLACLDSVLASLPPGSRLHVVDDAGPDPALAAALDKLHRARRIRLLRLPRNRGFPGAANAGIAAAAGRDVVLLNSDTLVPPGWLETLADALHSAPGIASACPLSNDATILSYPSPDGGNPMPSAGDTADLAALASQANGAATIDIPVAVGFCMAIRRDCLDAIGPLREDLFAQGYGEENDWSLRARHHGWRHVAVPGLFVAHAGGQSFGAARQQLLRRNGALLQRLHPGYDQLIADWIGQDPLRLARRRLDTLRWQRGSRPHSAVLVTHGGGGGVDRVIAQRCDALLGQGLRPIVLRPNGSDIVVGDGGTPNLRYRIPSELDALVKLLRAERPRHLELHHTLGLDPAIFGLAARLGVPQDVFVHDYAWFCPRLALVPEHTYCGEPPIATCEDCIADHGSNLEEDIAVPALVARSGAVLAAARSVLAPSRDVASRMRRHFPAVRAQVSAWDDDAAIAPPPPTRPVQRVCVVGGIGVEKGYEVLLGCVRDAAKRRLDLQFTVVGHTADDERLLDAGPVFITGTYRDAEVVGLIQQQGAQIGLLPSIWPETWCFTLGHIWRAGLRAAVFDLGAPAERVRATGWGAVLPLGLPPPALNDWLLRAGGPRPRPVETVSPKRPNPAN